jgi:hypothetical protein
LFAFHVYSLLFAARSDQPGKFSGVLAAARAAAAEMTLR